MSSAPTLPESAISAVDFERFRDFFYRKTGIYFEANKRYFVDKRLLERMAANDCSDFRRYFSLLRFQASGAELQQLINIMTVNETYFFREQHQFDCLVGPVLDEVLRQRDGAEADPVRIWSVPSSTGEEPYSIALYLLERWPAIATVDVEVHASDIDSAVLARARAGLFSERSVARLPLELKRRYFTAVGDQLRISDELRQSVAFNHCNLCAASGQPSGSIDVAFCRNLLIYFDDASRRQAAEALFEALKPGGFLFLGHSESMSRISGQFTVRRFPQGIVYQKAPLAKVESIL